jgi:hypothetical protein
MAPRAPFNGGDKIYDKVAVFFKIYRLRRAGSNSATFAEANVISGRFLDAGARLFHMGGPRSPTAR